MAVSYPHAKKLDMSDRLCHIIARLVIAEWRCPRIMHKWFTNAKGDVIIGDANSGRVSKAESSAGYSVVSGQQHYWPQAESA